MFRPHLLTLTAILAAFAKATFTATLYNKDCELSQKNSTSFADRYSYYTLSPLPSTSTSTSNNIIGLDTCISLRPVFYGDTTSNVSCAFDYNVEGYMAGNLPCERQQRFINSVKGTDDTRCRLYSDDDCELPIVDFAGECRNVTARWNVSPYSLRCVKA